MAPAMELLDELTEEIFFRIHPADAMTLARAALVCRRWCRLIADPGFHRRLHEFHRAPPMLGFSCNFDHTTSYYGRPDTDARFLHTSSCLERADMEHSRVLDTRHGHILLNRVTAANHHSPCLFVWDPITKEEHKLGWMPLPGYPGSWNAAVLCTAAGCNHLDCHGKPFTVVFVATRSDCMIFDLVYSSKVGWWSKEKATHLFAQQPEDPLMLEPSALVGNALYFMLQSKTKVLKYSVRTRKMHMIHLPPACFSERRILLMATEDSRLGFATVRDSKLCLWSRDGDPGTDVGWTQRRVIDLKALLPTRALLNPVDVVGFADGVGIFFIKMLYCGHFRIDTKSNRVKKLRSVFGSSTIFPYMSFHTPALGAVAAFRSEESSMGASSA
ncbi:unnamed protein product [Urochloa decumbens]|uniref:F-box domain-containing protein n=1 Tax=Urochloa decumbens TaxID=240449 RepID=A0ABC9FN11_9POAL